MSFLRLFRLADAMCRIFTRSRAASSSPFRFVPSVEYLEDRTVLAKYTWVGVNGFGQGMWSDANWYKDNGKVKVKIDRQDPNIQIVDDTSRIGCIDDIPSLRVSRFSLKGSVELRGNLTVNSGSSQGEISVYWNFTIAVGTFSCGPAAFIGSAIINPFDFFNKVTVGANGVLKIGKIPGVPDFIDPEFGLRNPLFLYNRILEIKQGGKVILSQGDMLLEGTAKIENSGTFTATDRSDLQLTSFPSYTGSGFLNSTSGTVVVSMDNSSNFRVAVPFSNSHDVQLDKGTLKFLDTTQNSGTIKLKLYTTLVYGIYSSASAAIDHYWNSGTKFVGDGVINIT